MSGAEDRAEAALAFVDLINALGGNDVDVITLVVGVLKVKGIDPERIAFLLSLNLLELPVSMVQRSTQMAKAQTARLKHKGGA